MWLSQLICDQGFASLHLGSSLADFDLFETQPGQLKRSDCRSRIVRLADVEAIADDIGIVQLKIDFRNGNPSIPEGVGRLSPTWNRDTDVYTILEQLDEAGLRWEIDQRLTFDRQLTLHVEKICEILFDLDRRELQAVKLVRTDGTGR